MSPVLAQKTPVTLIYSEWIWSPNNSAQGPTWSLPISLLSSPAPLLSLLVPGPQVSLLFLKYAKLPPASRPLCCLFSACSTPHRCSQGFLLCFFKISAQLPASLQYLPWPPYVTSNPLSLELPMPLICFIIFFQSTCHYLTFSLSNTLFSLHSIFLFTVLLLRLEFEFRESGSWFTSVTLIPGIGPAKGMNEAVLNEYL